MTGWLKFLLIVLVVVGVAAGIVFGTLYLLRPSSRGTTVPTPQPTPTPTIPPGEDVSEASLASILFSSPLPAIDGFAKYKAEFLSSAGSVINFVLIGQGSRTAFYIAETGNGTFVGPFEFNPESVANSTTLSGTTFDNRMIAYQNTPTGRFYTCDVIVVSREFQCQPVTWPVGSQIDKRINFTASWQGVSPEVVFSFEANGVGTLSFTAQSLSANFPLLRQEVSDLNPPVEDAVIHMCGSQDQTFQTLAWTGRFSNAVFYVTLANTSTPGTIHRIRGEINESVVFADMTHDGRGLVVLSNRRLRTFVRQSQNDGDVVFQAVDAVSFPSDLSPTRCAVERRSPALSTTRWCVVGSGEAVVRLFALDQDFRIVPERSRRFSSPILINTQGAALVHAVPDTPDTLLLVATDTGGRSQAWIVDTSGF